MYFSYCNMKEGSDYEKYPDSEEQKQTVNEPAAAYGLDLNSLKMEIAAVWNVRRNPKTLSV